MNINAYLKNLLDNDVPVYVSAGNEAQNSRQNVDTAPAVFKVSDFPLVVVGANDLAGNKAVFPQRGPLVTIWGPRYWNLMPKLQLLVVGTEAETRFPKSPAPYWHPFLRL